MTVAFTPQGMAPENSSAHQWLMPRPPKKPQASRQAANPEAFAHLSAWRDHAGLTQEQVANILRVSNVTIHRWESGKAPVTVENFLALAKLYKVQDPAQLMFPVPQQEVALKLRRALAVLDSLPADQASHWLDSGESLSKAFSSAEHPSDHEE
jgi:transcriptional regulator with XRE-family HTH domain